ncbi:MAG: 6,7-dimethyl-8-ribityllumazine synthase [Spirochaetia bacterium]
MELLEGTARGRGHHIAVLVNRTGGKQEDRLLDETVEALTEHGISKDSITVVRVPGTWEIPITLEKTAGSEAFDAVIVIGLFEPARCENIHACTEEIQKRCTAVSLRTGKPVTSVLVREGETDKEGHGSQAAKDILELIDLLARIHEYDREFIVNRAI